MPNKCVVHGCKTGYASCRVKLSTFSAPKNEEIRQKWQEAICPTKSLTPRHVVCEKHFTTDQIIRSYMLKDESGKVLAEVPLKHARLEPNAIPTKLLSQNAVRDESIEKENVCQDGKILSVPKAQESSSDSNSIHMNEMLETPTTVDVARIKSKSSRPAAEFPITLELNLFGKLLANSSAIQLPDNWYVAKPSTNKCVAFYEIYFNEQKEEDTFLPVTRRSLTVDRDARACYSIHSKFINPLEFSFPEKFKSLETLCETIERFANLKICCGIAMFADVNLVKGNIGYIDNTDQLRHKKCPIITDKQQCNTCRRVKRLIYQKKLRMKNREQINNDRRKNTERTKRQSRDMIINKKKSLKQVTSLDTCQKEFRAQRCTFKCPPKPILVLRRVPQAWQKEVQKLKTESILEKCEGISRIMDEHRYALRKS